MSHNLFNDVIYNNVPMNTFPMDHSRKFSFNMGQLVPTYVQEVVPGDTFSVSQEQLIRMAPMVAPPMHRCRVKTYSFFVPNRLQWDGWEDFITNPLDPANPAPFFDNPTTDIKVGSLADYLGYPTGLVGAKKFNVFAIGAYFKIWDDYFRDQNLMPSDEFSKFVDGGNNSKGMLLRAFNQEGPYNKCWEKDYFTSALPFPQKGEAVTLALGGTADIDFVNDGTRLTNIQSVGNGTTPVDGNAKFDNTSPTTTILTDANNIQMVVDNSENLEVDLTSVTAISVEDLRRAFRLQEWLEINARSGNRYIESIQNHFGVRSSDARLQRAEFLGGGSSNISFSEVLQMSASDETTPQGNMAGHGINAGSNGGFTRTFEEHGYIISLMCVIPDTAYNNPTPRQLTRLDPLDYLWPKFAQLGEQAVYNYEVDGEYPSGDALDVFGYQGRYTDYKYNHSTVHGDFKTDLDYWHMSRKFASHNPVLNPDFVISDPTTRIFAVEDINVDKLYCVLFNRVKARRPLPRYNIPTT